MTLKWKFKNNTKNTIMFNNVIWQPNEEHELAYSVPAICGLTCTQEGNEPEPVLFHDDLIISAGAEVPIELNTPTFAKNVALSIMCMTSNSGCECRFNSNTNTPIPIDVRSFIHVMPWFSCSKIFLKNTTENDVHISVSAVEVVS